jgi:hypothetical protein
MPFALLKWLKGDPGVKIIRYVMKSFMHGNKEVARAFLF